MTPPLLRLQEQGIRAFDSRESPFRFCKEIDPNRLRPHFVKAVVRVHEYPDGTVSVFLGPHRLARFAADGQQISPDAPEPGSVLGAVKDKPSRARKCASLTAPARAAVGIARVGTEKRASSRTKKPTRRANQTAIAMP